MADLLGDKVVQSQADHEVARVVVTAELTDRRGQQRIAQKRSGAKAQREGWLACSVSAQRTHIAVIQGIQELAGDRGLYLADDCLSPSLAVSGDPSQVGLHEFMMTALARCGAAVCGRLVSPTPGVVYGAWHTPHGAILAREWAGRSPGRMGFPASTAARKIDYALEGLTLANHIAIGRYHYRQICSRPAG